MGTIFIVEKTLIRKINERRYTDWREKERRLPDETHLRDNEQNQPFLCWQPIQRVFWVVLLEVHEDNIWVAVSAVIFQWFFGEIIILASRCSQEIFA